MAAPPPTQRLAFREMDADDVDLLGTVLGDPMVLWVSRAWTQDEIRRWIARAESEQRERGYGMWIVTERESGAFVGEVGLTEQVFAGTRDVEVGYQLRPEFWGRGYATEAARASLAFGRDVVGLERIVALIDPRNTASQRVAAKLGMAWERNVPIGERTLGVYAIDFAGWPGAAGQGGERT